MVHSAQAGHAHPAPDETLSDLVPDGVPGPVGPMARAAYALGAIGLVGATAADAIAVAGRHTGLHLLGSIELVQTAVVMLATSAMLIVTILNGHASVHIVTERLSPLAAGRMARAASLVSGAMFLIIAAGSAWVLTEMWNAHEQTELLHIPLRWLRLVWVIFATLIALRFFHNAVKRPAPENAA